MCLWQLPAEQYGRLQPSTCALLANDISRRAALCRRHELHRCRWRLIPRAPRQVQASGGVQEHASRTISHSISLNDIASSRDVPCRPAHPARSRRIAYQRRIDVPPSTSWTWPCCTANCRPSLLEVHTSVPAVLASQTNGSGRSVDAPLDAAADGHCIALSCRQLPGLGTAVRLPRRRRAGGSPGPEPPSSRRWRTPTAWESVGGGADTCRRAARASVLIPGTCCLEPTRLRVGSL